MKRILIICLTLLPGWATSVKAQEAYRFSLGECVEYAVAHHKNILNNKIDELAAKEKVREYLSAGYPQINGAVQFQHYLQLPTSLIPASAFGGPEGEFIAVQFGTTNNATAGITANQLVFDGLFFVGLKAANEFVELTRLNTARTENETAYQVSKAYYTALAAETGRRLLENSIEQAKSALQDTRTLQINGLGEAIDVDRLSVTVNNLETELSTVNRQIELARYLLKFQMGMPQRAELVLTETIDGKNFNPAFFAADEPAMAERTPEHKVLKKSIEMQSWNIKRYKAGALPNIYLSGNLQTQAFRNKFDFFDTSKRWFAISYIGVNINIPIFDGFRKGALIKQARLEQAKLENEIKNLQDACTFSANSARTQMVQNLKTMEVQKRNLDLAQNVLSVTQTKIKQGVGVNMELINAQSELTKAQINYVNALMGAYLARVDYQKAIGALYPVKN